EDGIRDFHVTGVQTCALPIYAGGDPLDQDARRTHRGSVPPCRRAPATCGHAASSVTSPATSHRRDRTRSARTPVRRLAATTPSRSEERRVGKERRARWSADPA